MKAVEVPKGSRDLLIAVLGRKSLYSVFGLSGIAARISGF